MRPSDVPLTTPPEGLSLARKAPIPLPGLLGLWPLFMERPSRVGRKYIPVAEAGVRGPLGKGAPASLLRPSGRLNTRRALSCPIAPVLVGYPSRPGRSGLSLHRTDMMAMIHGLRGWKPVTRVPLTSFSFRPLARPENALLFGLFRALPRSYRLSTPGVGPGLTFR